MSVLNWLRRPIHSLTAAPRRRLGAELLEARTVPAGLLAVGTDAGIPAAVRIFRDTDTNSTYETQGAGNLANPVLLSPYGSFTGGVRVALGDFDGNSNDELVTAAGPGGAPHVIVWDLNPDGTVAGIRDSFFAFDTAFTGGTNIAAGDVNGDGKDELVIAADAGGGAHVKVFSDTDGDGLLSDNLADQFFPYANFSGGVRVALGNTNNAGGDEIITAAGPGGGPHVKVYTDADADRQVSDDPLAEQFFPYAMNFTGGVYVAAGGIENAGNDGAEVITGAGAGGAAHVRVFADTNASGTVGDAAAFDEFFAYDIKFTGGVRVAAGDTDASGTLVEVVTAPGVGGSPHIKIYDDNGDTGAKISDNALDDQFFADASSTVGSFVAFGKVQSVSYASTPFPQAIPESGNGDLKASIIVPPGAGLIRDLDISLYIDHTFLGDLDVTLRHVPSNTTVTLFTDIGGTDAGLYARLNDEAGTEIGTVNNPNDGPDVGTFNLEGNALLSAFDGLDASGQWELTIADDNLLGNDIGSLLGWTLHFSF